MNPIHLVIAPTFLTANDDRDVATYGSARNLRMAKYVDRRRPGRAHAAQGWVLARGLTKSYTHFAW